MNKKLVTGVVGLALVATTVVGTTGCGKKEEETSGKTQIIVADNKFEIGQQFLAMESRFEQENPNIDLVIEVPRAGDTVSAFEKVTALGKTVTVAMVEPGTLADKYADVAIDLGDEKWVADTESAFADKDGKIVGFPFAVEGFGIVFNRAVVEKAIGGAFDEKSIKSLADFKALVKKVQDSGIKKPIAYQTEAWSVGNHFISQFVNQGDSAYDVIDQVKSGDIKLADNQRFNELLDTMDVLANPATNFFGKEVLGTYYDQAHVAVGSGEAAFLFNGNWAYDSLKATEGSDFGFIAVPVGDGNNNVAGKITAGPTQVFIINKKASKAQQEAGKTFLNWIVYNGEGQNFLVNECQVIPAFKNITISPTNPLAKSIQSYIAAGAVVPFSTNYINPGDYFNAVGPEVQKYLAGKTTRAKLANFIQDYHTNGLKK